MLSNLGAMAFARHGGNVGSETGLTTGGSIDGYVCDPMTLPHVSMSVSLLDTDKR